jgi:hypothetical protein
VVVVVFLSLFSSGKFSSHLLTTQNYCESSGFHNNKNLRYGLLNLHVEDGGSVILKMLLAYPIVTWHQNS